MNSEFHELHAFLRQLVSRTDEVHSRHPDFARVESYWHLGRIVVETEQQGEERAAYGIQLIESLADLLTLEFGKGYKRANLWWFRQFYLSFPILHAVRGELVDLRQYLRIELTWTHYRQLLSIDNLQKRHFYMHTAADECWSTRTLIRLIKARYYEQVALGEDILIHQPQWEGGNRTPINRRSWMAQLKQRILGQPHWAMIDVRGSGFSVSISKPDFLFYRIDQQRFVGMWTVANTVQNQEIIRRQLDVWHSSKAVLNGNSPVGLIVSENGKPKPITGSLGNQPSSDHLLALATF